MSENKRASKTRSTESRNAGSSDNSSKKPENSKHNAKYDENGIHLESKADLCDCLDRTCDGCWFKCPKCSSTKCGHECRNNRSWEYLSYEIEGTDITVKNPFLKD
ncbi:ARL14 effector protein [Parasteatoda tepidariorum]|uniref:ARL14 effector protein n=1 Tax=Parasteatoda tepidariorum TaxID=114398 RepID=UPI00077F8BED|nr:ARL14 effector protein [Parasteatoda tepidariorum]